MILAPTTGAGGGGLSFVSPGGDPAGLEASGRRYEAASASMASAAGQLRASVGVASAWDGPAALAHAERARALAAAHEVAAEAFAGTSQVLTTYAGELRQAQALAREAGLASGEAAEVAVTLAEAQEEAARASTVLADPAAFARFGLAAAESAKMLAEARVAELESALEGATIRAERLESEARALLATATQRATASLASLTSLAGSGGEGGLLAVDPWSGYLGVAGGGAAVVLEAAQNLGGLVVGGDPSVLGDLESDPVASLQARWMAETYLVANARDRRIAASDVAFLRRRGVWRVPAGFASDSPAVQALVAARARAWLCAHPRASEGAVVLGLRLTGWTLGLASMGLTLAAVLQGGEDPLADQLAAEADAAAVSAVVGDAAGSAAAEGAAIEAADGAAEAPAELASEAGPPEDGESTGGGPSRRKLFERLALDAGAGELGADLGRGFVSGRMDWIGLAFDVAALAPGLGGLVAEGSALSSANEMARFTAQLRDATAPEEVASLSERIRSLESSRQMVELIGGALDAQAFAISAGGNAWSTAGLGLSLAGLQP